MDRDLVEQAQRGDREAFAILARTHGDRLMAIAHRILRDVGRAEDAVQQTPRSSSIEGIASLDCHVIVRQSSEVIDLAVLPPTVAAEGGARAAAFVRLADEHLDRAYRLARAILREPAEAEDATHDAFVQAWRKWDTLRDPASFERWFDRILVNTCRNRLRAPSSRTTDISAEVALATGDHAGRTDDRAAIATAIAGLSPDHQVVVALRYFGDLTIDDIAARLGIPAGTVQSRLHYALKRLHESIDDAGSKGTPR